MFAIAAARAALYARTIPNLGRHVSDMSAPSIFVI